jgi:hypothetical protein
MSGFLPVPSAYAFMAWTRATLPFYCRGIAVSVRSRGIQEATRSRVCCQADTQISQTKHRNHHTTHYLYFQQ